MLGESSVKKLPFADCDDRDSGNSVEALDYVVVVNVVDLVKNHNERMLNAVTEMVLDVFDGHISRQLVADVD